MCVPGVVAVAVVDIDLDTVAAVVPICHDGACRSRAYGLTVAGIQIDAGMKFDVRIGAVTVATDDLCAVDRIDRRYRRDHLRAREIAQVTDVQDVHRKLAHRIRFMRYRETFRAQGVDASRNGRKRRTAHPRGFLPDRRTCRRSADKLA